MAAAQDGDEAAIAQLWRALNPPLLRYLRGRIGSGADDVAAPTWLDAARGLPTFDGDDADFRRWLFTIARRRLVDELRRRGRRRERLRERADGDAGSAMRPASSDADDLGAALALVRQLPPDQADAVLLRVVVDLDVAEVAEVMGRSEGSVRVLTHRGLRRLQDLLERARCNARRPHSDVPGAMTVHDDDRDLAGTSPSSTRCWTRCASRPVRTSWRGSRKRWRPWRPPWRRRTRKDSLPCPSPNTPASSPPSASLPR